MFKKGIHCGGKEVDKCRERLSVYCIGSGVDIGCGGQEIDAHFCKENKISPLAIGVDLQQTNLIGNAEHLFWFRDNTLDYVFSSHLLEHLYHPQKALKEWFRVLRPGGYLVLYLPLKGAYPCLGTKYANRDHKWDVDPDILMKWLHRLDYEIVKIEPHTEEDEYSFDFVVRKV